MMRLLGLCMLLFTLAACGSGGGAATDDGGNNGAGDGGGDDGGGGDGGGGGGDPTPTSPFNAPSEAQALYYVQDFDTAFDAVYLNYNTGGLTPEANLPSPSVVTYQGFMEIAFETTPAGNVHSTASLELDMQTGATTGNASEFMGWAVNPETGLEELALYVGTVEFSGGNLTTIATDKAGFDMQILGSLDNGLQEFSISGQIDGAVYGPEANGLFAGGSSSLISNDITLEVDDVGVNGTAAFWGLKQ